MNGIQKVTVAKFTNMTPKYRKLKGEM